MKKSLSITALLLCLILTLSFALTACGEPAAPPVGGGPNLNSKVESKEEKEDEESKEPVESLADQRKRRHAELDKLKDEYKDTIEASALDALIEKEKSSKKLESTFKRDSEKYMNMIRERFNNVTAFKSEGSLIGPNAPATYDEALAYIREEFKDKLTDEAAYKEQFDNLKATYGSDAQKGFDALRRQLWDDFECVADDNSYFRTHP